MRYLEETIYEAGMDDEIFAELPQKLASAFSARSCSLLWQDNESGIPLFTHSRYYSEEHLADYFSNFAQHDLWIAAASAPERLNLGWLSSQAIDSAEYASSVFFNEWIKPMGDDTFHALGATMLNTRGSGTLGLHRGRGQGDFEAYHCRQLDSVVIHLRRMLSLRSKLAAASREAGVWREGFLHTSLPTLVVDSTLRIRLRNANADLLLAERLAMTEQRGTLWISPILLRAGLGRILHEATKRAAPQADSCFARDERNRIWKVHVAPLVGSTLAGCAMLTIECVDPVLEVSKIVPHLVAMYALTNAEAQIAVHLANSASVEEIAFERGSSEQTVRTQIKAIMSKMNTRRQSEVSAIVTRLR